MKKFIILTLLYFIHQNVFIFGTTPGITNNYKCLQLAQTYYFSDKSDLVKCIRIDSSKLESDSVYYPNYNLCFVDTTAGNFHSYSTSTSSWIGKKKILKPNGDNIFINRFDDSITIKTAAIIGEKWVMWHNNQVNIVANVIAHDTMSFLGLSDSVKTIRLQSVDKNGNPVNFIMTDFTFKLSKKYGLIQTPSLFHFPYKVETPYDNSGTNYQLIGLSSPKAGFQNLTWKDVFDFEVGDELHIHESSFNFGNGTEKKIIHKIISREEIENNYKYTYLKKQLIRFRVNQVDEITYSEDTITQIFKANTEFDKLPYEPQSDEFGQKLLPRFGMKQTNPEIKFFTFYDNLINRHDSLIWIDDLISDVGYYDYYEYRKGLGGPYYEFHPFIMMGEDFCKLVYYQKGNNTWGIPFDKLQNNKLNENSKIKVYVDRQNAFIQVLSPFSKQGNNHISIYDSTGKMINHTYLESEKQIIQSNNWPKGIYFYSIINNENYLTQGKIIID